MKPKHAYLFLTVVCSLLVCCSSLMAREYFVSPSGNNTTGNGTIGNPWRTIRFAIDSVYPGDVLYLREGVYNEQLVTLRGGTADDYVTISSFADEDAFIDGTGVVTGNNGAIISHSRLKLIGFTVRNWLHSGMEILNCEFIELLRLKVTRVTGGIHLTGTVHDFLIDSCMMYDYYGGAGGFGFDATPEEPTDSIYRGVIRRCKAYLTGGAFDNCDGFGLGHDRVSNIRLEDCEAYGVGDAFDISGSGILLERCSAHHSSFGGGYKLWRDSVTLVNCLGYNNPTNVELDFDFPTNKGVNARLINCTFFGAWNANIFIENSAGGSTLEVFNCILAGGENTGLTFDGDTISGYTGDYNLFHMNRPERMVATSQLDFSLTQIQNGDWTAFSGQDSHTRIQFSSPAIFQDTLWINPNLHLMVGSLAIDNGTALPDAPLSDFDNCPRNVGQIDMGAYEFGACGTTGIVETYWGGGDSYRLDQNYPNPFNPSTAISFTIPPALAGSWTEVVVYDLYGSVIANLVRKELPSGTFLTRWDGTDDAGIHVSSGVYLYRIRGANRQAVGKMMLIR